MRPRRLTGQQCGRGRLYRNNANRAFLLFQIPSYAAQSTSCPHSRYKHIYVSVCIRPDFRPSRCVMRFWIRWIDKLTRNKAMGILRGKFRGFVNGPLHALRTLSQNYLSSISFQQQLALPTHCLRHGQNDPVASGRAKRRQPHACIAACGFDNHRIRLQQPLFFRVIQHLQSYPVLYASGRIHSFQFHQNLCLLSGAQAPQANQWSVSSQFVNALINFHALLLSL